MKKLNLIKHAFLSLAGACLLFSCKSTPDLSPVDAFELLDGDATLYLSVPVQSNQEFVTDAVKKVAQISEDDAKKIAERLDTAYVAVGINGEIQLSATGKIPQSFLGMAFSEKKGWKTTVENQQTIYTHKQTLYQLCLPSSSNAFLSHDIEPMVKRYNKIAYSSFSDEQLTEEQKNFSSDSVKTASETLSEKDYAFLHDNKSADIVMYSPLPKAFLKASLGASEVTTPVESLYAVLSQYRGVKDQFNVRLVLNMSDARTVKATTALLKTALFGVPAKIVQTGQKQITITDLPVSQERFLSIIR